MKTWHALAALGAITVGLVAVRSLDQRRHESEFERLRADVVALSPAAAMPRAKEGIERPLLPSPEPAAREPDEPAAEAMDEEDAKPKTAPGPRALEPEEMREHMEEAFAQERSDPGWSPKALSTARRGLATTLSETSTLRAIDCRESMCRIETSHRNLDDYRGFVQATFMDSGTHLWNGGFFSTIVADPRSDQVTVVSYLAREGEELSPPETLQ